MTHATAQVYRCSACGHTKPLPEHPSTGTHRIRTGCPDCGRLTAHLAHGRAVEAKRRFDESRRSGRLRADGGRPVAESADPERDVAALFDIMQLHLPDFCRPGGVDP